jgi:hypothetical protein
LALKRLYERSSINAYRNDTAAWNIACLYIL